MEARQRSPVTAAVTIAALLFLFLPLAVVLLFSFHKTGGLSFPFTGFSLRWYRDTLGSFEFRQALENSAIVAVSVSLVTLHRAAKHLERLGTRYPSSRYGHDIRAACACSRSARLRPLRPGRLTLTTARWQLLVSEGPLAPRSPARPLAGERGL